MRIHLTLDGDPDTLEAIAEELTRCIDTQQPLTIETPAYARDGSVIGGPHRQHRRAHVTGFSLRRY